MTQNYGSARSGRRKKIDERHDTTPRAVSHNGPAYRDVRQALHDDQVQQGLQGHAAQGKGQVQHMGRSKIRWTNLRNPLKTGYSLKINMGGSFTYMAGPKFAHSQVLYLWQDRRICRRRFFYYGRTEEFAVRYDRACECGRQSVPAGDGSSSFLRQALSTE